MSRRVRLKLRGGRRGRSSAGGGESSPEMHAGLSCSETCVITGTSGPQGLCFARRVVVPAELQNLLGGVLVEKLLVCLLLDGLMLDVSCLRCEVFTEKLGDRLFTPSESNISCFMRREITKNPGDKPQRNKDGGQDSIDS
ncbi:unnamed protein product [Pleuronectes platessa]|uniref:Uncharacterized protein n=1 Tax=Pleuronectes platessa TaxID=8262 RepID=A0A9N7TT65_PLEPL|nr:unnamed protein product [Pleuronectes platessa]